MVKIYSDRDMLRHAPPAGHPEKPGRLQTVWRELEREQLFDRFPLQPIREATDEELARVHDPAWIAELRKSERSGGGQVEEDTWISEGSERAARLAAGAVVDATAAVVAGEVDRAFCLVRPPGHHARPQAPMGFCLFGSVAVAAADAMARFGLERVLIVDWDVHHGNGTQEIFERDPRVGFFSIHRHPFYPGTGLASETGTGPGLGTTRNVPIRFGTSRRDYLQAFQAEVEAFADLIRPQLILLSAGFDAHAEDPVGSLGLEIEDFVTMTGILTAIADQHTGGRLVSVLEGGYNPSRLAGSVVAHLEALGRRS